VSPDLHSGLEREKFKSGVAKTKNHFVAFECDDKMGEKNYGVDFRMGNGHVDVLRVSVN
jgi:hypothetical protein